MDPVGFCGEQKVATFNGTGTSVRAEVEGEGNVTIAWNTNQPLHRGGFTFRKATSTRSGFWVNYSVNVHYNMTPQVSGKKLTFTAGAGDPVTGQTTLNSGICNFKVGWNKTTHFIEWEKPNCSGWTEISHYTVTVEYGCDATPGVCTLNKALSSEATNASFEGLPTGLCKVCVTAVNYCNETTLVALNFSIESNSGNAIHETSHWWMCMMLLAIAFY